MDSPQITNTTEAILEVVTILEETQEETTMTLATEIVALTEVTALPTEILTTMTLHQIILVEGVEEATQAEEEVMDLVEEITR